MKPVFFTDRDLGKTFPRILQEAGIAIEPHSDHFAGETPDAEWLPVVADRDWYVLSNDLGIHRKRIERELVINGGIGLFLVVGGHAPMRHLAHNFVNTYALVEKFIEDHERPFIAKIYRPIPKSLVAEGKPGSVELKWP